MSESDDWIHPHRAAGGDVTREEYDGQLNQYGCGKRYGIRWLNSKQQ
jgi:hypothetical protein